jgi:hypothetical protein
VAIEIRWRTKRCSEREPADSLGRKFNVIGGWLPSLTSSFAMTMLEPHWKQERPEFAATQKVWRQTVFQVAPWSSPALEELLTELRATHVNGGALFGRFSFCHDPVLHWFISRNRFDEIEFFEHLLTSDALREALPSLKAPVSLEPIKWEWWSSYLLGGDWGRTLMAGGAYGRYKKGGRPPKDLRERVCSDLFGDR